MILEKEGGVGVDQVLSGEGLNGVESLRRRQGVVKVSER